MIIQQGDQYSLSFNIVMDGGLVTPDNCEDVTIVLGEIVGKYSDGSLTFSGGKWLFYITTEETSKMKGTVECQIRIRTGGNIIHSKVLGVTFGDSVPKFKGEAND